MGGFFIYVNDDIIASEWQNYEDYYDEIHSGITDDFFCLLHYGAKTQDQLR